MTQGESSVEAGEQPAIDADDDVVVTVSLGAAATAALHTICNDLSLTYAEAVSRALQVHAATMTQREVYPVEVNPVADAMAKAAKVDPKLPYSLMLDAWDRLEEAVRQLQVLGGQVDRLSFSMCLDKAVLDYLADPAGYRLNARALPVKAL